MFLDIVRRKKPYLFVVLGIHQYFQLDETFVLKMLNSFHTSAFFLYSYSDVFSDPKHLLLTLSGRCTYFWWKADAPVFLINKDDQEYQEDN